METINNTILEKESQTQCQGHVGGQEKLDCGENCGGASEMNEQVRK